MARLTLSGLNGRPRKAAPDADISDVIVDAYTEALLTVRRAGVLTGDAARVLAQGMAAARVSQATGRVVTPEMVARLTSPW